MELPDVGQHCGVAVCQQLDFLPFVCEQCQGIFCENHQKFSDHGCDTSIDKVVPTCPLCNQIIVVLSGQNVNTLVNRHIEAGCPKEDMRKMVTYRCSFGRCRKKEKVRMSCRECEEQFCMRHRYPRNHECPSLATQNNGNGNIFSSFLNTTQQRINATISRYRKKRPETKARTRERKMRQAVVLQKTFAVLIYTREIVEFL
eukprot:TRINITY_DN5647_c0_g1_i3.p1 TRINITY_DN5647_c0_g1~~TRINITY_DN5647_c0_g1_i3.p1  ORF type:complete len:201 (-),score=16.40 TRINITY_DN5647_c0_g1_i3:355-957(-)